MMLRLYTERVLYAAFCSTALVPSLRSSFRHVCCLRSFLTLGYFELYRIAFL